MENPAEAGERVTTSSDVAASRFADAAHGFIEHRAETQSLIARALDADPDLVAAHCLRGLAMLGLGRRSLDDVVGHALHSARESVATRGASVAEHAMVAALAAWTAGEPRRAITHLDDARASDVLRLKLAHGLRFLVGDTQGMYASVERALAHLRPAHPGYGHALGMRAFALVELGALEDAARSGYAALEHAPGDVWGAHAVVHVHDVRGEHDAALALLDRLEPVRAVTSNFGAHLDFHRARIHIARAEHDAALVLYDTRVAAASGDDYRDAVNAVALLDALERGGTDVGGRWTRVADVAASRLGDHGSAFADVHYVIALARSGREDAARAFVASMRAHAIASSRSDAEAAREVGVPLSDAILRRDHHATRALLAHAQRLGGSRIQRELFAQLADAHQSQSMQAHSTMPPPLPKRSIV